MRIHLNLFIIFSTSFFTSSYASAQTRKPNATILHVNNIPSIGPTSVNLKVTHSNPPLTVPKAAAPTAKKAPETAPAVPKFLAEDSKFLANGIRKIMATIYQSCKVLDLAPMPRISDETMPGIKIDGMHSDGIGRIRKIEDNEKVKKAHYYVKEAIKEENACELSAYKINPKLPVPIYNYGGKGQIDTDEKKNMSINLFTKNGQAKTVGIDCSGFVINSLLAAGLKPGRCDFTGDSINFDISAAMLASPEGSGCPGNPQTKDKTKNTLCIKKVSINDNNPVREGDIIAFKGHVVMIESVQDRSNPFGIKENPKKSDCELGKINPANYKFRIAHSSPINGGTGINIMQAGVFFNEGNSAEKVRLIAQNDCLRRAGKYDNEKTKDPSIIANQDGLSFVRHQSQDPSCRMTPLPVKGSACVSDCKAKWEKKS